MTLEIQQSLPIILISVFSIGLVFIDAFSGNNKKLNYFAAIFALLITGGAAAFTLTLPHSQLGVNGMANLPLTKNMLSFGGFAAIFDIIFCLAGVLTLLGAREFIIKEYEEFKEFYSLILSSVCGMMFIAHANNLLVLFIGIEMMSLSFYVLAGYFRLKLQAIEAAIKYFLLGSFATGFLLYGIALIYGATGSVDLTKIYELALAGKYDHTYFLLGTGLIVIGLSFKIAAFPFHQWAPDVYQGSPTVVTGFMSTAGKAAAAFSFLVVAKALIPAIIVAATPSIGKIQLIIAIISAATMLIGNITAIAQKNVKRMLAYSSVAHAGYLLMGIVANNATGQIGITFYSVAYLFMQIGAFAVVGALENKESSNLEISNFAGLKKTHPFMAVMMAIFMFSLAGIPPFAGFFGKYFLFKGAIESGFVWLTLVAVVSSVISVYFYLNLIVFMFFKEPANGEYANYTGVVKFAITISAAALLIFGLFPSLIVELTKYYI